MSKVTELYKKLENTLDLTPNLNNQLFTELSKIISQTYNQAMSSDEGYCYKFILPMTSVLRLFSLLKLDQNEVCKAFQADWKFPADAFMYNDPYYQILLLIMYHGIKIKNNILVEYAYFILMLKIWNGRKAKFIPYCDKKVMNYVVSYMVNNKHLVTKYDSPLTLIKDYFVPTLLKKYKNQILDDSYRLRQLFMQTWARVNQMFAFNPRINMETGKNEAQGGLLPLYMEAKAKNLTLINTKIRGDEEEEPEFDRYTSIHNRDEIITNTTDFITNNSSVKYPDQFISSINVQTKVSTKIIEQMLQNIHNHNYYDLIRDILTIILSRTEVTNKEDICKPDFINNVKRMIISSKNNPLIRDLQKLLDILVTKIFTEKLNLNFNKYSNVQQIQIRNVIIYGLVYNLKKCNC